MSAALNDGNTNVFLSAWAFCRAAALSPVGSGASQTTTFLIPPDFGLTTQSLELKSLSLAHTSSSLVAFTGCRAGGEPLAVAQTMRPLTVTHLSSAPRAASAGIIANRPSANNLRIKSPSKGVLLDVGTGGSASTRILCAGSNDFNSRELSRFQGGQCRVVNLAVRRHAVRPCQIETAIPIGEPPPRLLDDHFQTG